MASRVLIHGLGVDARLHRFVESQALPDTGLSAEEFWSGVAAILRDLTPWNTELLERRADLQSRIDAFHAEHPAAPPAQEYEDFLRDLGYLVEEPADFRITTEGVDREIFAQPGPQLVVPLLNARFAVNAANARWGSLYDALYGTDAVAEQGELRRGAEYNPVRGAEVVARGRAFLDQHFPLTDGSHAQVTSYAVVGGTLTMTTPHGVVGLVDPEQFVGVRGEPADPRAVVLVHHGLHVELHLDRADPIGALDPAGVNDIVLEAAITTIMDLEDSVAAVDAQDKVLGYGNWLALMQGTLSAQVAKSGATFTRSMNDDRVVHTPSGGIVTLPGRALLFVRQVGHLMTTDMVLDPQGDPVPEGILDAVFTGLGSVHDLRGRPGRRNSRTGSMYVVKPKLHGPAEVAFTCALFARVEELLGLAPLTIKVGIMDEERRTSVNLKACIEQARDRIVFINTGFLDRTGDEIHTSMLAGPMVPKGEMRSQPWMAAYEAANVEVGLACGFRGRAQIGKGMWAAPDNMAAMLRVKGEQPAAGANCAWVPSPTAATLHALHYHDVDVLERQREIEARGAGDPAGTRRMLLTIPLGDPDDWSPQDRQDELDNNLQGILGYVVRWVDAGVGCSKVPDLAGVALMEDRATCRISSQHVANWLRHGVVTRATVERSLRRMAAVVDEQNADDPDYAPMAPDFDSQAFLAACDLVFEATTQPSGYTEPILHARRLRTKAGR